jgi:hypothetical protein
VSQLVVEGDDHDEAYTTNVRGVRLSHEMAMSQGPRSSMVSKATRAVPLCEALTIVARSRDSREPARELPAAASPHPLVRVQLHLSNRRVSLINEAIWLNGRPLLASSPTASRLNSSVN